MTCNGGERAENLRLMARLSGADLASIWRRAGIVAEATDLRRPETGLVTLRGRIGGDGLPFNFGEATVTRAAVRLSSGEIGHSYVLGRDPDKARLCAVIDAAWQDPAMRGDVRNSVISVIRAMAEQQDAKARAEVAATRVDFFTMVRGED